MMQAAQEWLSRNHETIVHNLADLVAIPSISTDGEHGAEIERTAALTCEQMRQAGLQQRRSPARRRLAPLRLRRMARRARQADRVPLRPSRRAADQLRRAMAVRPLDLTPRDGRLFGRGCRRRQGRHRRPARGHRRLPEDPAARCRSTSRCSSKARKRSARAT